MKPVPSIALVGIAFGFFAVAGSQRLAAQGVAQPFVDDIKLCAPLQVSNRNGADDGQSIARQSPEGWLPWRSAWARRGSRFGAAGHEADGTTFRLSEPATLRRSLPPEEAPAPPEIWPSAQLTSPSQQPVAELAAAPRPDVPPRDASRLVESSPASSVLEDSSASSHASIDWQGPEHLVAGQPGEFRIVVENTGTEGLSNIEARLVDIISTVMVDIQLDATSADDDSLAPGATREWTLRITATRPGIAEVGVLVVADQAETRTNRRLTIVTAEAQIAWAGQSQMSAGQPHVCAIQLHNPTTAPIDNLHIEARVPDDMAILVVDRQVDFDRYNGTCAWRIESLAAGATETIQWKAQFARPGATSIRFRIQQPGSTTLHELPLTITPAVEASGGRAK